jgi:pimeloyl-ACP methyl ester carboxylesterase
MAKAVEAVLGTGGISDTRRRPAGRVETAMLHAAARIDRFVLERFLSRQVFLPRPDVAQLRGRLERARAFYADPRFVAEPDTFYLTPRPLRARERSRRRLADGELVSLGYETDFVPVFPEARDDFGNDGRTGVARWWRHAQPGHPAMICIHGYAGGHFWLEQLAFEANRFYRAGLDVLLYVLPYHGLRAPHGRWRSGEPFFDLDMVRTNEAFAQAIYELRALLRHLRARGTGPVGAFGMSLGGYTTALLATLEPELAFAVPMIPLTSLADVMWSEGEGDPRRALAEEHGWSFEALRDFSTVHAPLSRPPLVPPECRLIIAARADRITPPAQAEALWMHWNRPRIHWYPGGHLAQFRRSRALRQIRRLLRDAGMLPRPS